LSKIGKTGDPRAARKVSNVRSSDRPFGILPDQRGCRLEVSAPFRGTEGPDQRLDPLTVRAAALPSGAGCDKADPFRAHPAATRGTRSPTTNGAGPSPRNHRHDRRSRKKDEGIIGQICRMGTKFAKEIFIMQQ
jgi:hypothetical protein